MRRISSAPPRASLAYRRRARRAIRSRSRCRPEPPGFSPRSPFNMTASPAMGRLGWAGRWAGLPPSPAARPRSISTEMSAFIRSATILSTSSASMASGWFRSSVPMARRTPSIAPITKNSRRSSPTARKGRARNISRCGGRAGRSSNSASPPIPASRRWAVAI